LNAAAVLRTISAPTSAREFANVGDAAHAGGTSGENR
jgi:hypothetical protein